MRSVPMRKFCREPLGLRAPNSGPPEPSILPNVSGFGAGLRHRVPRLAAAVAKRGRVPAGYRKGLGRVMLRRGGGRYFFSETIEATTSPPAGGLAVGLGGSRGPDWPASGSGAGGARMIVAGRRGAASSASAGATSAELSPSHRNGELQPELDRRVDESLDGAKRHDQTLGHAVEGQPDLENGRR